MLEVCKGLLAQFGVRPEQYQIGRSKLFFRAGVLGQLEDSATRINKCVHSCCLPGLQPRMPVLALASGETSTSAPLIPWEGMPWVAAEACTFCLPALLRACHFLCMIASGSTKGRLRVHAAEPAEGFARVAAWRARAVLYIQSYRRMLPVRRAFLEVRAAAVTIQAASRGRVARRDFIELRTRHRAALRLQAGVRGHQARQSYAATRHATRTLQAAWRRRALERRVLARSSDRVQREAAAEKVAAREAATRAAELAAADEAARRERDAARKERAAFASIKVRRCLESSFPLACMPKRGLQNSTAAVFEQQTVGIMLLSTLPSLLGCAGRLWGGAG
jgi:hypothetical protein